METGPSVGSDAVDDDSSREKVDDRGCGSGRQLTPAGEGAGRAAVEVPGRSRPHPDDRGTTVPTAQGSKADSARRQGALMTPTLHRLADRRRTRLFAWLSS